jgi:hypothetical protein
VPLLVLVFSGLGPAGERRTPLRERLIGAVVVAVAATAVVMPWLGPNLVRFDEPVLLSTNDGTTLLGAYCDASFFGPNTGGWTIECVSEHPTSAPDVDASVRNPRRREAAFDYAEDHAGELPRVAAARILRTVDLYGIDALLDADLGDERARWAAWTGIVSWWILAPLAVVGWILLPGRSKLLLGVPVVIVFGVAAAFYGGHRIRSTLEPVVVLGASVAVVAAWDGARAWRDGRMAGRMRPPPGAPQQRAK